MNEPQIVSPVKLDGDDVRVYSEHLLNTDRFRKSPVLRHMLQYLMAKAAEGRLEEIKESIIAIDVFGRSQDFDSRLDNIVRVQAHRLRKLLEAHYAEEGSADAFIICIPKGSYVPQIHRRQECCPGTPKPPEALVEGDEDHTVEPEPRSPALPSRPKPAFMPRRVRFALALAGAFAAGACLMFLVVRWTPGASAIRVDPSEDLRRQPLAALWGSLLDPNIPCVVSFTNPAYLWTERTRTQIYMPYRGPLSAPVGARVDVQADDPYVDPDVIRGGGPFFFSDSWTGTGEVYGAARLARVFAEAGKPIRVARSRTMTINDMRNANVIFLGSTWANELQNQFNAEEAPLVCYGRDKIVNRDPRPGQPAVWAPVYDPKTSQLVSTYVLFSSMPGVTPGTRIMSSAGIQTYGTHAAIDFLTTSQGASELIRRLNAAGKKAIPEYFQAVIKLDVIRSEPANATLVFARELQMPRAPGASNPR
jgi:hypothetical protein